jgi:hypothetical protein
MTVVLRSFTEDYTTGLTQLCYEEGRFCYHLLRAVLRKSLLRASQKQRSDFVGLMTFPTHFTIGVPIQPLRQCKIVNHT